MKRALEGAVVPPAKRVCIVINDDDEPVTLATLLPEMRGEIRKRLPPHVRFLLTRVCRLFLGDDAAHRTARPLPVFYRRHYPLFANDDFYGPPDARDFFNVLIRAGIVEWPEYTSIRRIWWPNFLMDPEIGQNGWAVLWPKQIACPPRREWIEWGLDKRLYVYRRLERKDDPDNRLPSEREEVTTGSDTLKRHRAWLQGKLVRRK